ncbi:MAG: GNAT family N-acetyltransferase [Acidimicrobiia bacterium]|nr:GNAT family N-acetyltransferase [Acidimicrobiia bacterium]
MTSIRRAAVADARDLGEIVARFFAEEGFPGEPADLLDKAGRFLSEPANAAFLATDGEEVVGVATITTTFGFEVGRYAELEDLYVVPTHRSAGLASDLVEAAVAWCRSRECSIVEVVVTPDGELRHHLTAWYLRRGFSDEGRHILWRRLADGPAGSGTVV